jgi:ZIP family zinc transporter
MDIILSTIFGFSFIFLMTSLGSLIVFFFHHSVNEVVRNAIFAAGAGVMLSASFWGLLAPSIEEAKAQNLPFPAFVPCVAGFLLGCLVIFALDLIVPLFQDSHKKSDGFAEAIAQQKAVRAVKLFLAVSIHNAPEGAACGLVFGHAFKATGADQTTAIRTAIALCIGIGLQDIPEGAAVALPVRELTGSTWKGFIAGVLSGAVEPIAGGIALAMTRFFEAIDPWALGFSAGAMLYVTLEELVPDAMGGSRPRLSLWVMLLGFLAMTIGEQLV